MSPAVAIVTRTHNRPELLDRAMRSVLGQTLGNWLHIIVNDGGEPGPVDLLHQHWAEAYQGRCHILHLSRGRGMQEASNEALRASPDTEFACIHDDDDSWHPRYLEETIGYLQARGPEHREQGVVTQTLQILEEFNLDGQVVELSRHDFCPMDEVSLSRISQGNLFPPIAFLYRRAMHERIGYFNQLFDPLGDFDFNLRFLATADIGLVNQRLAYYHWRTRDKNQSVTSGVSSHRQMLARMKDYYLRRRDTPLGAILAPIVPTIPRPPGEQVQSVPFAPKPPTSPQAAPARHPATHTEPGAPCMLPQQLFTLPFHKPADLWCHWEDQLVNQLGLPRFPYAQARGLAALRASKESPLTWKSLARHLSELTPLDADSAEKALTSEQNLWHGHLLPLPKADQPPSAYCDTLGLPDSFWEDILKTHKLPAAPLTRELTRPDLGLCPQVAPEPPSPVIPFYQQASRPYTSGRLDLYSSLNLALSRRPGKHQPSPQAPTEEQLFYKLGKEVSGPLVHDYLQWVLDRSQALNKHHIFFLSRDGYYLHRLFRRLKEQHQLPQKGTYLWGSRRMLNLAQYKRLDHEALAFLMSPDIGLSVRHFLSRLGFDPENYADQAARCGFASLDEALTVPTGGAFLSSEHEKKLTRLFHLLEKPILGQAAAEREDVQAYLASQGFDPSSALVVDLGWKASSARSLQALAGSAQSPVHATYFATWKEVLPAIEDGCHIESYFLHKGANPFRRELLMESPNLVEMLFQAPHPSIQGIQKNHGTWQPVYTGNDSHCGIPEVHRPAFEQGLEDHWAERLPYHPSTRGGHGQPYAEIVLERLLREPEPEETRILGAMLHPEGFGTDSYLPLAAECPPDDAPGEDWERAYHRSNWRKAFITRIGNPDRRQIYIRREHERLTMPPEFSTREINTLFQHLSSNMDLRTWLLNQTRLDIHNLRRETGSLLDIADDTRNQTHQLNGDIHNLRHETGSLLDISNEMQAKVSQLLRLLLNPRKLFYYLIHPKKKP